MVSWEEAFLIFNKWRDDPGPPLISLLRESALFSSQEQDQKILSGGTVHVLAADATSGVVTLGLTPKSAEDIDLSGATFRYSDPRDTRLVDGEWECSLEAILPDGTLIVFAEWPSVE